MSLFLRGASSTTPKVSLEASSGYFHNIYAFTLFQSNLKLAWTVHCKYKLYKDIMKYSAFFGVLNGTLNGLGHRVEGIPRNFWRIPWNSTKNLFHSINFHHHPEMGALTRYTIQ